ncbi:hypothetical protein K450DRAFT_246241 [Umbelopsis ramanniana AG]|uniref:WLM domain-containing protein n=1 Tax=Umbelopsis ramanniana AG TaxID=1314678 RepID=A0AAD5E6T5_UMBRA|nr:uncharacterized protein K450DRAFT_246241 [Umbelopsis ramanniana AG]KAI8578533.1 hypothetical protein K450DRAFT_246241 [Umbelopsis ramanniana AG]
MTIEEYKALKKKPKSDIALNLLKRLASQVAPIMKKRGWKVKQLAEFYPSNPSLLGLNVNKGYRIDIRLRSPADASEFLPYDDLLGTLLHELTHIVRGPHDVQFYKILNEVNAELDDLISTGYSGEGFYSQGKQLGSSRQVSKSEARKKALEAAEKRQKLGKLMLPAGGRRLGGGESAAEREAQFTPQELAAEAAERRRRDNIWCGGQEAITQEAKPEDYVSTVQDNGSTSSNKRRLDDIDDKAWACNYCTFMNEPLHLVCSMCLQEKTNEKRIKSS